MSHKLDGKLPLLAARPAVTPATVKKAVKVKKSKRIIAVSDSPPHYGNSHAIWDHTVLPATRQR